MSLPLRAPSEVEVVAHRGVSAEAPEHTLAAYQQALALGADCRDPGSTVATRGSGGRRGG